ncbi:hypothetical protein [Streptomyces sp. NPDC047434]
MTHEAMWEQVEADLLPDLPIVARITSVARRNAVAATGAFPLRKP